MSEANGDPKEQKTNERQRSEANTVFCGAKSKTAKIRGEGSINNDLNAWSNNSYLNKTKILVD